MEPTYADLFNEPARSRTYDHLAPQHAWKHMLAEAYRYFIQGTVHDEIAYLDALNAPQAPIGFSLDER